MSEFRSQVAFFPVILLILSMHFLYLVHGQASGPSANSAPQSSPATPTPPTPNTPTAPAPQSSPTTPTPPTSNTPTAPSPANCVCSVSRLRFSSCSLYLSGFYLLRHVCCLRLDFLTNAQVASCLCATAGTTDTSAAVNRLLTACGRS